jgi:hypothetical protein
MSRQYSNAHHKARKALLPYAYGTPCPLCGQVMQEWEDLDLDHSVPRVLGGGEVGDRITHAKCNRSAGATLGNRMRGQKAADQATAWFPCPTCPERCTHPPELKFGSRCW